MAWRTHHDPAPSPPGQLALTGPLSGTIPSLTDSTADLTRAELDNAETGWQVASAALPGRTRARRSAAGLCWVITPAPASDAAVLTLTGINSSTLIHGGMKASWQSAGGGSVASTIVLTPSTDKTGAADTAAINTAMASVGAGGSVLLDPGDWYTDVPLDIPDGTELAGIKGGINGHTSMSPAGSVIHPVAGFSGPGVLSLSAVSGVRIRDLAIVNDMGSPPDVDGISCHGNVTGLEILHISVAFVSGYGLAFYQVAGVDGDGLWMSRCMFQRTGKSAVHRPVNDANIHNVHIQYAGNVAGASDGHGFFTAPGSSGNMVYVGCRADLCAGSGWLIDHKGSYGDATKLVGCSTERNCQDGVLITNSSAAGTDWRGPVIISGCCFEGDGMNKGAGGEYAGIRVRGRNRVFIDGTTVVVNNIDAPAA